MGLGHVCAASEPEPAANTPPARSVPAPIPPAAIPPAPAPASPAQPDPKNDQPRSIIPSLPVVTPDHQLPLDPIRPNLPGLPAAEIGYASNPPLQREGAFISNARGQVVRGKSGRLFIVFDADANGRTQPPMVLLQNANLASIERLIERAPAGSRIRVSGQTTVYRDRNFLLVTTPPLLERTEPTAASATPAASKASATETSMAASPAPGAEPEPSMEKIIEQLDKAVGTKRDPASRRSSESAPGPGSSPVMEPESSDGQVAGYLVSRRGRLIRSSDGTLTFRLDSGAQGHAETSFTLLPCTNLTLLEGTSDFTGEAAPIILSGDVTWYHGRSYLLPTMTVVPRPSDVVFPTH